VIFLSDLLLHVVMWLQDNIRAVVQDGTSGVSLEVKRRSIRFNGKTGVVSSNIWLKYLVKN
jgi:hypothetical protein